MIKIFNKPKKEAVISIISFNKRFFESGAEYFIVEYVPKLAYYSVHCYFSYLQPYNYIEINHEKYNFRKMLKHYEKLQALIEQEENLRVINNL